MLNRLKTFLTATEGAVVADYVVISAAIVTASINSVNAVRYGVNTLGDRINSSLAAAEVALFCSGDIGAMLGGCDGGTAGTGDTGGTTVTPPVTGGVRPPRTGPVRPPITTAPDPVIIVDDPTRSGDSTVGPELLAISAEDASRFMDDARTYENTALNAALLMHADSARAYMDVGQLEVAAQYLDFIGLIAYTFMTRPDSEAYADSAQLAYDTLRAQYNYALASR